MSHATRPARAPIRGTGTMSRVADGDDIVTIADRMRDAGISNEHIEMHLQRGGVQVDGVSVTDPNHPAPKPAKWVVMPA